MKSIMDEFARYGKPEVIHEDEYWDSQTGLLMCSKCHTPRQKHYEACGNAYCIRILCKCQKEERDRKEKIRKKQEWLDTVSRNRSLGMTDLSLRKYTFENDLGYNAEMKVAKQYVEHWDEMFANSRGLLIWGGVGTGKTFMAACIANALIDQGVPVMMTNFARILNTLTGLYSGDRNEYLDNLNKYPLLILDDLGMERKSEFAQEQVFNVIDRRYSSQKPMIVTTNLTLHELRQPETLAQARIFDRVRERCVPLCVNGRNLRQELARENMAAAQRVLRPSEPSEPLGEDELLD